MKLCDGLRNLDSEWCSRNFVFMTYINGYVLLVTLAVYNLSKLIFRNVLYQRSVCMLSS